MQRLQWVLSESTWDHQQVNNQRVRLLCEDPATAPHQRGVLVIDDTGDPKDGTATAHLARQYLGLVGKIDNGIVAVTSLWADERVSWPVQAVPYTPASRLSGGEQDPGFWTKPHLAVELVGAAQQAGVGFWAVVADCASGDNPGVTDALLAAGVLFVLALKPRRAPGRQLTRPTPGRGRRRAWLGELRSAWSVAPSDPPLPRWSRRDLVGGGWGAWWLGPDRRLRLVVATTDPASLPGHSSWELLTNLPRPASRRAQRADLAEVVRL